MKIKVSEATNLQLDWMVAKCVAQQVDSRDPDWLAWLVPAPSMLPNYHPTTDWSLAGPLIDREKLSLDMLCAPDEWRSALMEGDFYDDQGEWIEGSSHEQTGPTPLIAAMRCFVASKLGDEVEVPEELT